MKIRDPIVFRQMPLIQKIIQDETWLEGDRRGCHVRSDDRAVRDRVCDVILRVGQQLRDSVHATFARPAESLSSAGAGVAANPGSDPVAKNNEAA